MSNDDLQEGAGDGVRADGSGAGSEADLAADATAAGTTGVEDAVMPEAPIGTFFVMILFILLLVGLWGTVFLMLLNR